MGYGKTFSLSEKELEKLLTPLIPGWRIFSVDRKKSISG
jgi:hypothetical protein